MKSLIKFLTLMALLTIALSSHAVTYQISTGNYTVKADFTAPCGGGNCANFSLAMRTQGQFTLNAPLPPNMAATDITNRLTSFTMNTGVDTFTNTDPLVGVRTIMAATDGSGAITMFAFQLEKWQAPGPHVAGSRYDALTIGSLGGAAATHNGICGVAGPSPTNGWPDMCAAPFAIASTSSASIAGPLLPTVAAADPASIPTLSEYGLMLLTGLMGLAGALAMRKRGLL